MQSRHKIIRAILACVVIIGSFSVSFGSEYLLSTANAQQTVVSSAAAASNSGMEMKKLGKRSFIRCRSCHTLAEGEAHGVGPNLNGLFDAEAANKEGYSYSEALTSAGITWDQASLKKWLQNPAVLVPGNKMAFAGVADEKELDALMMYLKQHTGKAAE